MTRRSKSCQKGIRRFCESLEIVVCEECHASRLEPTAGDRADLQPLSELGRRLEFDRGDRSA